MRNSTKQTKIILVERVPRQSPSVPRQRTKDESRAYINSGNSLMILPHVEARDCVHQLAQLLCSFANSCVSIRSSASLSLIFLVRNYVSVAHATRGRHHRHLFTLVPILSCLLRQEVVPDGVLQFGQYFRLLT
jgi:hypothetical protein